MRRPPRRPVRRLGLALAVALARPAGAQPAPAPVAAAAPAVAPAAAPAALTAEQWREDLRTMAAEMARRHKNLYHTVSRERFAAAVAELDARIPSLRRHEILVGMMRIAALVGDGHTNVSPLKDARVGFRALPLRLHRFDDGVYVRAAAPAHAALVGARVEAVGGVPVDEALRRVDEVSPRDNAFTLAFYEPIYLAMPEVLHALGLAATPDAATLTLSRGGRRWTAAVPAGDVPSLWPPDTDVSLVTPAGWADARVTPAPPLWLAAPLTYHRLAELPDPAGGRPALYAQLNMVTGVPGQSLDAFADSIARRAAAARPRAVVLDVRLNRGGNGDLRDGLVRALVRAEGDSTRLFVLTARGSFSATQFILDDLARLGRAVLVGEPAASRPDSYGDGYRIVLPNSGVTVRTSIRWHQTGRRAGPWTPVDVAVPYTFADYAAGRDPALAAALAYRPEPPLGEQAVAAARAGGADAVRRAFAAYRADARHRYQDQARALVLAADRLLRERLGAEAVALLEEGARRFPDDADVFVVLAQAAEQQGRRDVARAAAERTLALEPDSRTARAVLDRLRAAARE